MDGRRRRGRRQEGGSGRAYFASLSWYYGAREIVEPRYYGRLVSGGRDFISLPVGGLRFVLPVPRSAVCSPGGQESMADGIMFDLVVWMVETSRPRSLLGGRFGAHDTSHEVQIFWIGRVAVFMRESAISISVGGIVVTWQLYGQVAVCV